MIDFRMSSRNVVRRQALGSMHGGMETQGILTRHTILRTTDEATNDDAIRYMTPDMFLEMS